MISLLTAASLFEKYVQDNNIDDLTVVSCVYRSKGEYKMELDHWVRELNLIVDRTKLRMDGHWYIKAMSRERKLNSGEPWIADVKYMIFDDQSIIEDTVCP